MIHEQSAGVLCPLSPSVVLAHTLTRDGQGTTLSCLPQSWTFLNSWYRLVSVFRRKEDFLIYMKCSAKLVPTQAIFLRGQSPALSLQQFSVQDKIPKMCVQSVRLCGVKGRRACMAGLLPPDSYTVLFFYSAISLHPPLPLQITPPQVGQASLFYLGKDMKSKLSSNHKRNRGKQNAITQLGKLPCTTAAEFRGETKKQY